MSYLAKFRTGEPVWVYSDGEEVAKYAGEIVRLKAVGRDLENGRIVEMYSVKIPELPDGLWEVPGEYLKRRTELPKEPSGLTDSNPDDTGSWDDCPWKPGDHYGKGKIYVPD